jgi:hypothetical protein
MSRSLFVSHVYEDRKHYEDVRRWGAEGKLGDGVVVTGETADVREGGYVAIERHLKPRIQGAAAVLVLVGNNTHNHEWVRHELAWATSAAKLVLAARVPGTTGAAPNGFQHLPLITLDPSTLLKALNGGR